MIKFLARLCLILPWISSTGFAGTDLLSPQWKEKVPFKELNNFYADPAKPPREGHDFILIPAPHRIILGDSTLERINTQVFILNLMSVQKNQIGYDVYRSLMSSGDSSDFFETACWMLLLRDRAVVEKCGNDRAWNHVTQQTLDLLLEQALAQVDPGKIDRIFLVHNHPGTTIAHSKIGHNIELKFFGPSPNDYAALKHYQIALMDKGVKAPVHGIVVPNEQPYKQKFIYMFHALDLSSDNYMDYVSQALENGALVIEHSF